MNIFITLVRKFFFLKLYFCNLYEYLWVFILLSRRRENITSIVLTKLKWFINKQSRKPISVNILLTMLICLGIGCYTTVACHVLFYFNIWMEQQYTINLSNSVFVSCTMFRYEHIKLFTLRLTNNIHCRGLNEVDNIRGVLYGQLFLHGIRSVACCFVCEKVNEHWCEWVVIASPDDCTYYYHRTDKTMTVIRKQYL